MKILNNKEKRKLLSQAVLEAWVIIKGEGITEVVSKKFRDALDIASDEIDNGISNRSK